MATSHGPTPAAITWTRTSSGPGSGRPTSSMRSTSGAPYSFTLIASMVLPYEFLGRTGHPGSAAGEPQHAVVDPAVPEHDRVVEVTHAEPPGRPGSRLGELVHGPQEEPGREVQQRPLRHIWVVVHRHAH